MRGRRSTHPALENQKGLLSVMHAPFAQSCMGAGLRNGIEQVHINAPFYLHFCIYLDLKNNNRNH